MRRMTKWAAVAIAAMMLCSVALAAEAPEGGKRKGKGEGKKGERRGPNVERIIARFDKGAKAGNGELEADELEGLIKEMAKRRADRKAAGDAQKDGAEKDGPKKPTPEGMLAKFDADKSGGLNEAELGTALKAMHQRRQRRREGGDADGKKREGGKKGGGKRKGGDDAGV